MEYYVGCSGFYYKGWVEKFYPREMKKMDWLPYYAEHFNSVEINSTFYQLLKRETFESWYNKTPPGFKFTLKGSRYVTHVKKMVDVDEPIKNFYNNAGILKEKLACVLWQLPGGQHINEVKLEEFCKKLGTNVHNVIEFRHNSWFTDQVYQILSKYNVGLCLISAPGDLKEEVVNTSDIVYLRFHGKEQWYNYYYNEEELTSWKNRIANLPVNTIYAYFNNDWHANAVFNAQEFYNILENVKV